MQVNGFTVVIEVVPRLSLSLHLLSPYEGKGWMKNEQVEKMALKAEQIWMIQYIYKGITFVCVCVYAMKVKIAKPILMELFVKEFW